MGLRDDDGRRDETMKGDGGQTPQVAADQGSMIEITDEDLLSDEAKKRLEKHNWTLDEDNVERVADQIADYPELIEAVRDHLRVRKSVQQARDEVLDKAAASTYAALMATRGVVNFFTLESTRESIRFILEEAVPQYPDTDDFQGDGFTLHIERTGAAPWPVFTTFVSASGNYFWHTEKEAEE